MLGKRKFGPRTYWNPKARLAKRARSAPYVRRRRRFTKGRPTSQFVKNVIMRLSEAKRKDTNLPFGTGSYAHDALYEVRLNDTDQSATSCPTALQVGGAPSARVGDEIYSTGFQVRGSIGLPFDRRNTTVKIWLVEHNSNQGSVTTQSDWFRNITGNNMLDPINDDKFPGVKLMATLRHKARDLYVDQGAVTDSGSIAQLYYSFWIPWRRKLKYTSTNGVPPISGCKERLSLVMTAYDTSSALTTDVVGLDGRQSVVFYYKDP